MIRPGDLQRIKQFTVPVWGELSEHSITHPWTFQVASNGYSGEDDRSYWIAMRRRLPQCEHRFCYTLTQGKQPAHFNCFVFYWSREIRLFVFLRRNNLKAHETQNSRQNLILKKKIPSLQCINSP